MWHMRTTLDLDDLEMDSVDRLLAMAGTFDIEDVSEDLRSADRTT